MNKKDVPASLAFDPKPEVKKKPKAKGLPKQESSITSQDKKKTQMGWFMQDFNFRSSATSITSIANSKKTIS